MEELNKEIDKITLIFNEKNKDIQKINMEHKKYVLETNIPSQDIIDAFEQNIHHIREGDAELFEMYNRIQLEKKGLLPPLQDLFIDGVLYLIQHTHGSVEYNDGQIKHCYIPENLQVYRSMSTTFGFPAWCSYKNFLSIKKTMMKYIDRPSAKTVKNKIKLIKQILKFSYKDAFCRHSDPQVLEKLKKHIIHFTNTKKTIKERVQNGIKRESKCVSPHTHHFMPMQRIVNKVYELRLSDDEINKNYGFSVVNSKYNVNLIDYLDIHINPDYTINLQLSDLFDLLLTVLPTINNPILVMLDYSCSLGKESTNKIETNALDMEERLSLSNRNLESSFLNQEISLRSRRSLHGRSPRERSVRKRELFRTRSRSIGRVGRVGRSRSSRVRSV
jgi:hypothetical protein